MAKENDLIPMKNSALKMLADKRSAQENGVKTIEPTIKRTQSTDPETGAITYRQSWESSSSTRGKSSSAGRKTTPSVRKTTSISPVGSKVSPSKSTSKSTTPPSKVSTSGSREVTSVPIPKPAGRTDNEIKAPPIKIQNPTASAVKDKLQLREEKNTAFYMRTKKEGETREQWNKRDAENSERAAENTRKSKEPRGSRLVFARDTKRKCSKC